MIKLNSLYYDDKVNNDNEPVYINNMKDTLNIPWIEKYRPSKIDDLVLTPEIYKRIEHIIKTGNVPNILLTGLPGIGKTSTVLCIAKNILKNDFNNSVIELNASDERGIKIVQESIEYFCKKKVNHNKHKIIILDEADNMTTKAQQSINILMEKYNNVVRFAFTCNTSSNIIESIQSKCLIIRYERLNNEQIFKRLKYICINEKIYYDDDGLNSIVLTSDGDLRNAINNLQLIYNGYEKITVENVYKLCDKPPPLLLKNIIINCKQKNIKNVIKQLKDLQLNGYSSSDITLNIIFILKNLPFDNEISEDDKIKFLTEFGKCALLISKGYNSLLQLTGCVSDICSK